MKNEQKTCLHCQYSPIHKYGTQNNLQSYKCPNCNKTFTFLAN
ncbi:transposase-like zinc-binding domain-containing protein [Muribacter muris]